MNFLDTPEKRDRRLVHLPMGRFGEAVEIAKAALFRQQSILSCVCRTVTHVDTVASDESSYTTVRLLS
jgi:NAD(P)-dependent dehydrogenase (short-subunit alcohol dehydrogenase family)